MIDVTKTVQLYNYYISSLKPSSCKLVVWVCENCGTEKHKKFRLAKLNKLCIDCSNKINANTSKELRGQKIKESQILNGHPRLGKKHSEESKRKMSEKRTGKTITLSEEVKEKFRNVCINRNKSSWMIEKSRKARLGIPLTDEHKKKISQNHADVSGKNNPAYGKSYPIKKALYTNSDGTIAIWMRSTWEVKYAKYLDVLNIEWEYEKRTFDITYQWENENKEGTYTPDFYLGALNEYSEIKGFWRGKGKPKFEAFKKQYPGIKINLFTKKELLENGIMVQ